MTVDMENTWPVVWITRAEPGGSATAERVRAMGFTPLVAPLLVVHPVDTPLDIDGVVALAFTSANGVSTFAARSPRRDLEVFAVGAATANVALAAGFHTVTSADNDGAALVNLIAQTLILRGGPLGVVLAPGPRHPALDLAGALQRAGIAARSVVLYETAATDTLPEPATLALMDRKVAAVLVHSARAGEALAAAASFDISPVQAVGLSHACLAPLAALQLKGRTVAAAPQEDALLAALFATLGKPPGAR